MALHKFRQNISERNIYRLEMYEIAAGMYVIHQLEIAERYCLREECDGICDRNLRLSIFHLLTEAFSHSYKQVF